MDARTGGHRPQLLEAGLFLVVVAVPLVFFPFSTAPFADAKLATLGAGTVLIAASALRVDRRLAAAATLWVVAMTVATVTGVDAWWSVLGAPQESTGLVLIALSALLVVAGTGIPPSLADRVPVWLLFTGAMVAMIAVVQRFFVIGGDTWTLGTTASATFGNAVFVGGFLAVAAVAAVRVRHPATAVALVLVGSGMAVAVNRAGIVAAAAGIVLAAAAERRPLRRLAAVAVPLLAAIAMWTALDASGLVQPEPSTEGRVSPAAKFTELQEGASARARLYVWRAMGRGAAERPVTGWGPGNAWSAFLSQATERDLLGAGGRGWVDAHNLPLHMAVTGGPIGLGSFGLLAWIVIRRMPLRGWITGAAATLAIVHLLQPVNVSLTPLLFLLAGLAATGERTRIAFSGWAPALAAALLAVSLLRLAASSLERYGTTYGSQQALRVATKVEPRRLSASVDLARARALDARSRVEGAGDEARALAARSVRRHPWHPGVRLAAADIERLLGEDPRARRWIDQHLDRFPNDPLALAGAASLALEAGDIGRAAVLARKAIAISPGIEPAMAVLNRLERSTIGPMGQGTPG